MNVLLFTLNAKYIHSSLALRSLRANLNKGADCEILELTINNRPEDILAAIYEKKPDILGLSCYIWNIRMLLDTADSIKKLLPRVRIIAGGPEAAHSAEELLRRHKIDMIIPGEGEEVFARLAENGFDPRGIDGVAYLDGGGRFIHRPAPPPDISRLRFAYDGTKSVADGELLNKIVYYETSRGCPYACAYCMSALAGGVRRLPLVTVFQQLDTLSAMKPKQIKFTDRTFNSDRGYALEIWRHLIENDNSVTNFHFEISGALLDGDALELLKTARQGLFQFEIGVQSTNPKTLAEIDRPADVPRLLSTVRQLLAPQNIHIHLDLIAGLPHEDFGRFQNSFNEVYACMPHQLQLGFLKVLSGSKMEKKAKEYDLIYSRNAPYEVLSTRWLNYEQLRILHGIAKMVDLYYNSARFSHIISHLISYFSDPFSFFLRLWLHYESASAGKPVSAMGSHDLLAEFARSHDLEITERMQWLTKFDLLLHEKPRKLPAWVTVDLSRRSRKQIQGFFMNPANIATYLPEYQGETSTCVERIAHLEIFPFDPVTGVPGVVAVVFNYKRKDMLGRALSRILPFDAL